MNTSPRAICYSNIFNGSRNIKMSFSWAASMSGGGSILAYIMYTTNEESGFESPTREHGTSGRAPSKLHGGA